eukprot:Blabericola_migrator_1__12718@NODE_814_length_6413_cov_62_691302_g574_i0_p1_GENE_NODE_814_length_6413_cov_62_691302_g574_i0NODE_814_length_6413_cov_62_691302_g574_i0_p1_ORF_typecomplete_len686_score95_52_NODE_814_length_6413_cov_62_691302_g574_i07352792
MSARRLQQPAFINASSCKWLGRSIVTTLAVLPQDSIARLPETGPHIEQKPPPERPSTIDNMLVDTDPPHSGESSRTKPHHQVNSLTESCDEGAYGGDSVEVDRKASVGNSPHPFLDEQNIRADFDGNHIPDFIRPETWIDHPNVEAVQEILEAYEKKVAGKGNEGSVEDLIKAKFPEGNFPHHLIAYLRSRIKNYKPCQEGSLEAGLMDAYVTGLKEWCAAALDIFILQLERGLSTHAESSEAADGHQGGRQLALWTPHFYEQIALHQKGAFDYLVTKASDNNPGCIREWHEYKRKYKLTHDVTPTSPMSARKFRTTSFQRKLHFISWLLRTSSPGFFLHEAGVIAQTIKFFGGPCHLVNLIQNMWLHPEDVADYKRLKRSVLGAVDTDSQPTTSLSGRLDLLKNVTHMSYPLWVLDPQRVIPGFHRIHLPPFLQLGYGLENFKTEAVNKIIELNNLKEYEKALLVVDQEFHEAEEFHEHFFGLVRTAMRNYAFFPKLSNGYRNSKAWYPHDFNTPFGRLLLAYTKGLQEWCALVTDSLEAKLDNAIRLVYLFGTPESDQLVNWVKAIEPSYTQSVEWLKSQIDFSSIRVGPPPRRSWPDIHPQVGNFLESMHLFKWLMWNMPWDCFLYFRGNLARTVREAGGGFQGFFFLANVLESLSFTDRDADEYRQYQAEMELRARWGSRY